LNRAKLQSLLHKGFEANQSIRELLLDHREDLDVDVLIKDKEKVYVEMYKLVNQNCTTDMPRFVYILNRFCQNKHDNVDMKDALSGELNTQLDTVSTSIIDKRMKIFNLPKDYSIPISEKNL
jgi:hypothetical protein